VREVLYGRQPVVETLRAHRRQVFKVMLARGARVTGTVDEALELASRAGVPVQDVERSALDRLGSEAHHQGLAAEVSGYPYVELSDLMEGERRAGESPFLLLLDHLLDPQNLGSLLRSAEAAGILGAVIPDRRAAAVTPAAVRASAGAAEHLCVAQVVNLVRAMESLQTQGVWLAGLDMDPDAQEYTAADLGGPLGLVVGGEGRGLSRLVRERCDLVIRLPMRGRVASLNAAVAGAIALYEARRQRGK
jgi:23S rRNA (guanosine2251-2'-O)-methyltransferase